jgi:hypothetical protein
VSRLSLKRQIVSKGGKGSSVDAWEIVEVATLGRVEDVKGKVVEDEQVDGDEFPQLRLVAVIEAGGSSVLSI